MPVRSRKRRASVQKVRKFERPSWLKMPTLPRVNLGPSLWGLVLCTIMGLFGSAAVIASQNLIGDFEVSRIEVEGDLLHLRPGQVQARLDELLLNQKTRSDLGDIQTLLLAQPWISDVRVRRIWPDALQVQVIEQRPQARWNQTQFLGMQGDLFEPIKQPLMALPHLVGPEGDENRVFAQHQIWHEQLQALGLELVATELDPALGWNLTLASGVQIQLGRLDLDERMQRFATAWRKRLSATPNLARVDLRYRHGLAMQFEEANNG